MRHCVTTPLISFDYIKIYTSIVWKKDFGYFLRLWCKLILPRITLKSPSAVSLSAFTNIYPSGLLHPAHNLMWQQDDVQNTSPIKTRIFFSAKSLQFVCVPLTQPKLLKQTHMNKNYFCKYTLWDFTTTIRIITSFALGWNMKVWAQSRKKWSFKEFYSPLLLLSVADNQV